MINTPFLACLITLREPQGDKPNEFRHVRCHTERVELLSKHDENVGIGGRTCQN